MLICFDIHAKSIYLPVLVSVLLPLRFFFAFGNVIAFSHQTEGLHNYDEPMTLCMSYLNFEEIDREILILASIDMLTGEGSENKKNLFYSIL